MKLENSINDLLKRVGLNQYESAVYTSLVSKGVSTVGGIAETSNVPRSRVYDVLTSLEKKGFAIVQLGRPVKYGAVKAGQVVEKLKKGAEQEYKNQLSQFEAIGSELHKEIEKISAKASREPEGDSISIIRGEDNIHNHIKTMIAGARNRLVKITDDTGIDRMHTHFKTHLAEAKGRGVRTRIITSNHKAKLPADFKNFAEARHNRKISGRFFVKDGNEAFVLTAPDTGILVKGQYLANSLEQLFEHSWQNSANF